MSVAYLGCDAKRSQQVDIGVDWYVRLEQDRDMQPSANAQVLACVTPRTWR